MRRFSITVELFCSSSRAFEYLCGGFLLVLFLWLTNSFICSAEFLLNNSFILPIVLHDYNNNTISRRYHHHHYYAIEYVFIVWFLFYPCILNAPPGFIYIYITYICTHKYRLALFISFCSFTRNLNSKERINTTCTAWGFWARNFLSPRRLSAPLCSPLYFWLLCNIWLLSSRLSYSTSLIDLVWCIE